jgi:hypothetical protein
MKKLNSTQDKKLGLAKKAGKLLTVKTGLKAGTGGGCQNCTCTFN